MLTAGLPVGPATLKSAAISPPPRSELNSRPINGSRPSAALTT